MLSEFTQRELDVLKLMASEKSNRQIAEELVLTIDTVRWYNKQLYSKLDVHNRQDAVEKAQSLGLHEQASTIEVDHNLPEDLTAFIGRENELADLKSLLLDDAQRIITLVGSGGMGKTRLSLAVARDLTGAFFPQGVFFVALQPLTSPDDIVSTIAQAIGFQFQPGSQPPQKQLLYYLSDKRMLLVLDNFEHLVEGASLIPDLLRGTSGLTILVTSRERLNIYGETIVNITGLQHTHDEQSDHHPDAVQLFNQTVTALRPDWQSNQQELDRIYHLCDLLEGIPLAIELAGGWSSILTIDEIVEEVENGLDILQTNLRDLPERHRSMQAVFDYSWQLLSESERTAFMCLSVFRGGFTREAGQVVADASMPLLLSLTNKSFLYFEQDAGRCSIHELLRQYGEAKLREQPDLYTQTRDRHATYFAETVGRFSNDFNYSPHQADILKHIALDFENIRVAWLYAVKISEPSLIRQLLFMLWVFLFITNQAETGYRVLNCQLEGDTKEHTILNDLISSYRVALQAILGDIEKAILKLSNLVDRLSKIADDSDVVPGIVMLAQLSVMAKDYERGKDAIEKGIACIQRLETDNKYPLLHMYRGLIASAESDFEQARADFLHAITVTDQTGDQFYRAGVLRALGSLELKLGNYRQAKDCLLQSLHLFEIFGQNYMLGFTRRTLGLVCLKLEEYDESLIHLIRGIDLNLRDRHYWYMFKPLIDIAHIFEIKHMPARAVEILATIAQHEELPDNLRKDVMKMLNELKAEISSEIYINSYASGRSLSIETLVQRLIQDLNSNDMSLTSRSET